MRIRHLVLFRFKAEISASDREDFLSMLGELPAQIPEILEFDAGFDILHLPRSFDLALCATYADLAALAGYTKHEAHLPVIERANQLCEQIASVDYEL